MVGLNRGKKLLAIMLALALSVTSVPQWDGRAAAADGPIQVYINEKLVVFDVQPMIINGRTMVPLRAIFEAMGAEVVWDPERQLVTGTKGDVAVELYLGSNYPSVNGQIRVLDAPATIVNGRTLAPLRFVGEAFGGSVLWDAEARAVHIYTDSSSYDALPKKVVDFSVDEQEMKIYEQQRPSQLYIRAGVSLKISVKIRMNTPDGYGGGKLMLRLGDELIDKVPLYMDKYDQEIVITKSYQVPLDWKGIGADGQHVGLTLSAEMVPDQLTRDSDLMNNRAEIPVDLQSPSRLSVETPSHSVLQAIKGTSDFGVGLAKAGGYLTLNAKITGQGEPTIAYFYINDSLVEEKAVLPSKNGAPSTASYTYAVPYENSGVLMFRVKLDSGDEREIPITVEPFEYEVLPEGISWKNKSETLNYKPGENLALTADILRINKNAFVDMNHALRACFYINGVLSEGLKVEPPSGSTPYIGTVHYSYPVPIDQTGPLKVMLLLDPGGLFQETKEDNNNLSVVIPEQIDQEAPTDFSVSALRVVPENAAPGERMELIAAIKNNSSGKPTQTVTSIFSIDGQPVTMGAGNSGVIYSSYLQPGQGYVTFKMWDAPQDLDEGIKVAFSIDPERAILGDDPSDNTATVTVPLAKPELAVEKNSLSASPNLISGQSGTLYARAYNSGTVNAEDVEIAFIVDGNEIGRQRMDIPKHAAVQLAQAYPIPLEESIEGGRNMVGIGGLSNAGIEIRDHDYAVIIDPDNKIAETVETNNEGGPKSLSVMIRKSKGTVYAHVTDRQGDGLEAARVTIVSGDETQTVLTDAYGDCTFLHVPFGAYRLTAAKSGFHEGSSYDEFLYSGNLTDGAEIMLDDRSMLTGTIADEAGNALEEVRMTVEGTGEAAYTDAQGRFSLKIASGIQTISLRKEGYEPKIQQLTAGAGQDLAAEWQMKETQNSYLSGIAYDETGAPLAGLTIEAEDVNGKLLTSGRSAGDGSYELTIPLAQMQMWTAIRAQYNGQEKSQGVYMIRGIPQHYDLSFEPTLVWFSGTMVSAAKVAPWVVCASMPGTFFGPDYKVQSIYGLFDMNLTAEVETGNLTRVAVDVMPDYWIHASVSSSWNPMEILAVNDAIKAYNTIATILPTGIPLAVSMRSTNKTEVRLKKVAILDGEEQVAEIYPDRAGSFEWAGLNVMASEDLRVKLYLKIDPDNDVANPAAGYNGDRVLIIWNPMAESFDKIANYQVVGWDEARAQEIYLDE